MTQLVKEMAPVVGRYLMVGLSGALVNLGMLWVLTTLGMAHFPAAILATEISIISNFILNNCWTFQSEDGKHSRPLLVRFWLFQGVALVTSVLTIGLFLLFSSMGIYYLLAQALAIGLTTVVNFTANFRITWTLPRTLDGATSPQVQVQAFNEQAGFGD